MSLHLLPIKKIKEMIKSREVSCIEVASYFLDRAKKDKLNCFISFTEDLLMHHAARSQEKYDAHKEGLIEGIPIAVKDLFCISGVKTTAGSKILENFVPPYESTVTSKLSENGGMILGKTNMDEFAMGSSNTNSSFGPTINPWSTTQTGNLVPGGSSGGSAASVAAGYTVGSLGTDTGGSIRQPASFTGLVGIKPTYGGCSRYGIVAFASSLDQAGVFAKYVEDGALLLQSIYGHDPKDSTSYNGKTPNFIESIGQSVKGLKIGIPKEYTIDNMPEEIQKNWQQGIEWLKNAGCEIVPISLPHTKYAIAVYYVIAPAEASSNLARFDGVRYGHRTSAKVEDLDQMYELTRAEGFGNEVKRRLIIGSYVLSAESYDSYYLKAQKVRKLVQKDFHEAFSKVDAILAPTTPNTAFKIGEKQEDPLLMYLNDVFTVSANVAYLPAMSIPSMICKNGLPTGLQLIGNRFQEPTLFKLAHVLEAAANFKIPEYCFNLTRND